MTGAELADELSTIADAYCADTREAWRMARFVNANMVALLAALRAERPEPAAGDVERAAEAMFLTPTPDPGRGSFLSFAEHAQEVERILAEDAGGSEEPDCHAYSRNSRTEEGAALWMIAHTLRQIRDRLPSPPPQEPQP